MDDQPASRVSDDHPAATDGDPVGGSVSVVVSRRVIDGAEDAFVQWAGRIMATAAQRPAFLSSELQKPDVTHPDTWVTVYRFATAAQLDAWQSSSQRTALAREAEPLLQGPGNEQMVAQPSRGDRPVTVVMTQRIRPERTRDFAAAYERAATTISHFPGFLRSEHIPPVQSVSDEHVLVFAFDTRAHLDRWLASDERRTWLARVATLIDGDRRMNVVGGFGGFGGWFPARHDMGPPKWKQATTVLLALFPTSLLLTVLRQALLPDLPLLPSVLLSNALGVAALTWLLMPRVTRALEPWLQR